MVYNLDISKPVGKSSIIHWLKPKKGEWWAIAMSAEQSTFQTGKQKRHAALICLIFLNPPKDRIVSIHSGLQIVLIQFHWMHTYTQTEESCWNYIDLFIYLFTNLLEFIPAYVVAFRSHNLTIKTECKQHTI